MNDTGSATVSDYRAELLKYPRSAKTYLSLGRALLQQGNHWEACASLRRALELVPELVDAEELLQQAEDLHSEAHRLLTLRAHLGQVHDIIALKDEDVELVVSASADGCVTLWCPCSPCTSIEQQLEFPDQVTKVVWDATNAVLAISCLNETCQLWQKTRAGWRRLAVLESKSGRFTCMCFLPGGEHLITGSASGALQRWTVKSGDLLAGVQAHGGGVTDIALHPTRDVLATSSGDKSCKVWDSSMLTCLHSLAADCGGVTSCHIASTGSAGSSAGQQTVLITVHLDPVRREGRILLWDLDNCGRDGWVDGKLVAQYASIDSFRGSVRLIPVSSSWGLHAVASSGGMVLHMLDLEEACCIFRVEDVASDTLCTSPDGDYVACAGIDKDHVCIYQLDKECMALEFCHKLNSKGQGVRCLAWNTGSDQIIAGGNDGSCWVWNVKS